MDLWGDRLSLDWHSPNGDRFSHSMSLFQEGTERHLDICVWFNSLEACKPDGEVIPLEELAEAGKRWWDAFYANDPKTQGIGIIPLTPKTDTTL